MQVTLNEPARPAGRSRAAPGSTSSWAAAHAHSGHSERSKKNESDGRTQWLQLEVSGRSFSDLDTGGLVEC